MYYEFIITTNKSITWY